MVKKWLAVSAAALVIFTGCSQQKEEAQEHSGKEVEDVGKEVREDSYRSPLTGIVTETESTDRAFAVMVNNHPVARPQSGLDKADVIYEVLAEGKVTRFLAIFESEKPEKVGPVRSARDYFIELAKGYDSLYIAHGYSPEAKELLQSGYIDHLNGIQYDGTLFKRADFRKAPHNSYITYDNIKRGAEENGYHMDEAPAALPFLTKDQAEKLSGEEAGEIMVSYGDPAFDVIYEYDNESQNFHRFNDGEETVDLDSKQSVLIDNIFIVEMGHQTVDKKGRKSIDLTSGGRGYLFQKGMVNEVEWKNVDGRILPFMNGKEAGFLPGKTWINIVPSIDDISFESES
ncbi:DUF3048 domain-containing protein [Mesobacillus foraminis]|uniref:DUF3048 domain-containing protein n=1 Tax=Mesobacillus foraminis TaxID=279826 RepID=UPI0039A3F055